MEKEEDLLPFAAPTSTTPMRRGAPPPWPLRPVPQRDFSRVALGTSDYDDADVDWTSEAAMLASELETNELGKP